MSVRFVIGRCGSGKTAHFFRQTVAACRAAPMGEPILWLVPRQATFLVERELCCSGELNGFFRVQVMSLELLCRQVLAEVGPLTEEVTNIGRQMILFRLLREHHAQLRYFRSVAAMPGLAAELGVALDELDRCQVDPGLLRRNLPDGTEAGLTDKLADLALLQTTYAAYLGQNRIDPNRRARQAIKAFERSQMLPSATVFVDGFLHFTLAERRILTALAHVCPSMEISLTMDTAAAGLSNLHHNPDELSLTHGMEVEFRKLSFTLGEAGVKLEKPLLLGGPVRFKTPALRRIEEWKECGAAHGDDLEMIEVADKRAEVEAVALRVRDLAAGGWRWRDVAVLARQISDYQDLIEAVFREHGIPFFVDARRAAGHHPLIQMVGAILDATADPWSDEAMLTLIKTGLCGLSAAESDELENRILQRDVRGSEWAKWDDALALRVSAPLKNRIAGAAARRPMRQWATDLLAVMEAFAVRQTLAAWIGSAPAEEAEEHQQVWAAFSECLDQLAGLLGDQEASSEEFQAVLGSAIGQLDLAIAPPTVDQVLVGQADRTRTPNVRACVVIGLSDGQFPLPVDGKGILSDWDRRRLAGYAELESDGRRRALDEEFLGYFAFTRASERLIVTRAVGDEAGRLLGPGSLWRKLEAMFGPTQVIREMPKTAGIGTPRQFAGGLVQWARRGEREPLWSALYEWLAKRPASTDRISEVCRRALPALVYANDAKLSGMPAGRIFSVPLRADARQIETFAACAFRHFAKYGLKLAARAEGGMEERDASRLCRDVLRRIGNEADDATLRELTEEAARKLRGDTALESARNRHLLDRIAGMVRQTIAARRSAEGRGRFHAAAWGERFEEVASGDNLLLRGEFDRVDRGPKGALIYNYQLNAGPLALAEVYYGLALNLMVDLLAWEAKKGELPALGALVSPLLRPVRDETPDQAPAPGEEQFDLLLKPRGIIDERFVRDLDKNLQASGASDVVAAHLKQDGQFGYRDKTDVAAPEEMKALLAHVRRRLREFAGEIVAGNIAVKPYKLGNSTPCVNCRFADVCRFDPDVGYRKLTPMKRTAVLDLVRTEQGK